MPVTLIIVGFVLATDTYCMTALDNFSCQSLLKYMNTLLHVLVYCVNMHVYVTYSDLVKQWSSILFTKGQHGCRLSVIPTRQEPYLFPFGLSVLLGFNHLSNVPPVWLE